MTPTPRSRSCAWHACSTRCGRRGSTRAWSTSAPAAGCSAVGGRCAGRVRPGLALYGLLPAWAGGADRDPGLRPALSLRALPLRIFEVPAGEAIGYGLRFRTSQATRIAVLGIGYGDGWPRAHANNGWVLVRGRRAPIVGAVSMDGLTVDLAGIDG